VTEAIPLPTDRHTAFAMTIQNLLAVLVIAMSETTEAIPSQATFVFGLLRYARKDKSQDGHEAQGLSP